MVVNQTVPSEEGEDPVYLLDLFRKYRVTAVFSGHEHYYERWQEIIRDRGRPVRALNWMMNGLGGVRPRGRPKYDEKEIESLLKKKVYRRYLERISRLDPDWTAELLHLYPTQAGPARFHNYVLVTVDGSKVVFQTKGRKGYVRDKGVFYSPDWSQISALELQAGKERYR